MDFDLRQLEAFCKVVEYGGFSSAAKVLNLAQASVSERIANLEAVVGTKLLDRLGRSVVPTKAGELLYGKAVDLLERKRNIGLEIEAFLGHWKGTIQIGGSTIPGNYILPAILGRFRKEYPEIIANLAIGDSDRIASMVSEGMLELGFVGSVGGRSALKHTKLWGDDLILIVPASHPWAEEEQVEMQDLRTEPFILREPGSGTQQSLTDGLETIFASRTESLNVACILGSSDAVKEGVKCGLGVAFISSRAVRTEVQSGLLKTVPVKGLRQRRHFYLVTDPRRARSPLCQAFIDFVISPAS